MTEPVTLPAGVAGSDNPVPTFTRICGNTSPHPPHNYWKRWHKRLLPHLRNPETYPETWDAPYRCPGASSD